MKKPDEISPPKDHPAKFPTPVLEAIAKWIPDGTRVLDPFAGVGGIHDLRPRVETVGVEIEPEWADQSPHTIVGSALNLPYADDSFDVVATSPTYGNRMADQYDGRDGSTRVTYRLSLGRPLHPDNTGALQWGPAYRDFHRRAWDEALRVLKPSGILLLNMKDHYRGGTRQHVTDWHIATLEALGLRITDHLRIPVRGMKFGANAGLRVDHETVSRLSFPE